MNVTQTAQLRQTRLPLVGLLLAALFSMTMASRPAAAAPVSIIPITGQLLIGGSPATGNYDFQFQMYTSLAGNITFGTLVTVTNVPVQDGVFYAEANFGSLNYGNPLWIQTSYRVHPVSGSPAYTALVPRHVVSTVVYAADANYATLAGTTFRINNVLVGGPAPTTGQVLTYSGTRWAAAALPAPTAYTAGNGLALSGNQFSVAVPLVLTGTSNPIISATNTGNTTAYLGGNFYGVFGSGSGILTGVRGENLSSGAGVTGFTASGYGVYGSGSSSGTGVYGTSSSGSGVQGVSSSNSGVSGTSTSAYGGTFLTTNGTNGVYGESDQDGGNGGYFTANTGTGAYGVEGNSSTGYGVVAYGAVAGLYSSSTAGTGVSVYGGGTSVTYPALRVSNGNASGIGIYSTSSSSDANLVISNSGTGDLIRAFNGGNNLYFQVTAGGTTITRQLQITGGADVAEPYTVGASNGVAPQPGMVVSIDPNQTGQMNLAHQAYDHTVAGIISGAGGIQPGLTLRQKGGVADGDLPIACTGRVWCYCDADAGGAITAGDLLTTSDTPGHAMKASDNSRSRGAILGKAMSSLKSGKGLVLVLVTLQ